ncbi:MAG: glycosyltransferase family 2 protein [Ignavibacteria bacterium]|nr:glycosyltransferase family 2 protein [Ignavibacteria bacterium]
MKVSVIIVNHNTGNILKDCLDSLYRFENVDDIEIFIIDNFSNDDSRAVIENLKKKYERINILFTDTLVSFSAANNLGIQKASGEYILIMNPDIIFTEPVLDKLCGILKAETSIGGITPALTGTDGKFQRNYFQRFPTIRQFVYFQSVFAKLFNKSARRMNKYLENQDIDISTGKMYFTEQIPCAFLMTTRNMFDKIGLMDENFILFYEDVDLCYRIAREKKLAVDASIKITHLGGSSFKSEDNWWMFGRFTVSMLYFFKKHYSSTRYMLLKAIVYVNSYIVLFLETLKNLFSKRDVYRYKKHQHLLRLLKK